MQLYVDLDCLNKYVHIYITYVTYEKTIDIHICCILVAKEKMCYGMAPILIAGPSRFLTLALL